MRYANDFESADEKRQFKAHGHLDVLKFEHTTIGRGVLEPGWRWSKDVKPLVGTKTCEVEHTGYCLRGRMTVQMDNGEVFTVKQGEAFHIPPGHDAWVEGDETCEFIDVSGARDYAKPD